VINNNCGYDGDLELALIPESFRTVVLKETLDSKGVLIENSEVELAAFALLFEFDGDQKHIRHVLYNCSASRPGIEGKTNEDSKDVQTEKLSLKAVPLANGMVKAKTGNTTNATTYADWYKAVYVPAAESNDEYKGYAQIATQMDFDAFYQNLCVLYNDSVLTLDAHLSILYLNEAILEWRCSVWQQLI